MEYHPKSNLIFLVLLVTVCKIQSTSRIDEYIALEPGHNITGKITEIYMTNPMDCIRRCLLDEWCVACVTAHDNHYVIIHRRGTEQEKQTLTSDAGGAIFPVNYTRNYTTVNDSPLGSWSGPLVALYYDFDTLTGLALMAGSATSNYDPLVPGKINKALVTDSSLNQWADLGILSQACITRPETCGPEGAAVSVWVKIHSCPYNAGILSSLKNSNSGETGFMFFCFGSSIRIYLVARQRSLWPDVTKTNNQWIHLVLNFIGPNAGEGIEAFKDGTLRDSQQHGHSNTYTDGDGRVVVGKKYANTNNYYAHVEVDELIFFNKALLEKEVMELYNLYQ